MRRLLVASLAGRLAFSMLPLAFVLFAAGSSATAGALVAAFAVTSALAPARGRIVDRHGPPALVAFAVACAAGIVAVALLGGAPAAVPVIVGGLAGLVVPPLGPFTRAVWGSALGDRLQRVYALDSAGEEAADIVAPLIVALIVVLASPEAALVVAAAGILVGSACAARSGLASALVHASDTPDARARLPLRLWLAIASLAGPGAAIGAVTVAVPALAREAGAPARAGLILAAFALGTPAASLLAGAWHHRRLGLMELLLVGALAAAAAMADMPVALAALLAVAGMALGALYLSIYLLVDELTPAGAATRTFAWLVTANNAGLALGAALAGDLIGRHGAASGLWVAAICAALGAPVGLAAAAAGSHADLATPSSGSSA